MGSSLLAMAWGINKSGLLSGIFINIFVAALCLYTAYVILKINEKHGKCIIIFLPDFYKGDIFRFLRRFFDVYYVFHVSTSKMW